MILLVHLVADGRKIFMSSLQGIEKRDSLILACTVEQENFTPWKFREIASSGGSRQENFANFQLGDRPVQIFQYT